MRIPERDLLVLLKSEHTSQQAIEEEVASINRMLLEAESADGFCIAHELVERNRITSRHHKILRASSLPRMKAFCFLINKN